MPDDKDRTVKLAERKQYGEKDFLSSQQIFCRIWLLQTIAAKPKRISVLTAINLFTMICIYQHISIDIVFFIL